MDWLFKQFPSYQLIGSKAYKPTLQNIERICELIGDPQNNLRFIHIAGTNGKGSCSSMTASILTETGLRTGLFTSPHIADFRERIRVNGEMIAEKDVIAFIDEIKTLSLDFEPSFFEITFAMALQHFALSGCEICVIETGLGGRLDATNIIHPVACLITNISLEHTAILGDTVEAIAGEKAGIIKKDTPVVIGEWTNGTRPVFERFAASNNAPIRFA
ncbi:MAG: bifunctional folylpolyglutamate synthase/dihydrofolate synthase, partial [Bacteroidota bacterium]